MKVTPPAATPAGVAVYIGRKGAGLYKVGDKVVYPHHGAGTVIKKEKREVLGEKREYLTIKILHNDMTVNVPSENAEKVGLRKVIGEDMVKVVVKALTGGGTQMPKNWNRRFKHNRDKMKTGDILELAEVVRNLSLRDSEKGLSTGEKQMFVKAKKILASELMYAKEMDEEATAEWLDSVLAGASTANGAPKKKPSSSSTKTPTAGTSAGVPSKASSKKASAGKAQAKKPPAKKATAGAR
jgi:CarD family transcriptional regulator